ncbi:MAG: ABC transporter permease [Pseudobdellovibrionaceae bacterium]
MRINFKAILQPVIALIFALAVSMSLTLFAGENPINVLKILFLNSFGTNYDIGMTLFYATPLIFTGLAVAMAGQVGMFNIGAEGQLTLGALTAAIIGATIDLPFPLAPYVALFGGLLVAGLWGFIPGWLKVVRGSHEVITTIMLNFVAAGIASFVTVQLFQNPGSMNPETLPIKANYFLQHRDLLAPYFPNTPLSFGFVLALIWAIVLWILLNKTVLGYQIRAVGQNEVAARVAGIKSGKIKILVMFLSGLSAGFIAYSEILASTGQFKFGFSANYGFTGIAVALMAANSPIGVIFTGLLFGALHKGASGIEFDTENITRDFSFLLQGTVILFVSAQGIWTFFLKKKGDA